MRGRRSRSERRNVLSLVLLAGLAAVLLAAAAWPHDAAAKKRPKPKPIVGSYVTITFHERLDVSWSDTFQLYLDDPCIDWYSSFEKGSAHLVWSDSFRHVYIPLVAQKNLLTHMYQARERDYSRATWALSGQEPTSGCPDAPPPIGKWDCRGVLHRNTAPALYVLDLRGPNVAHFDYLFGGSDVSTPDPPDCADTLGNSHDPLDVFTLRKRDGTTGSFAEGFKFAGYLTRRQVVRGVFVRYRRPEPLFDEKAAPPNCSHPDMPTSRRDTCRQSMTLGTGSWARVRVEKLVRG
jgi:hypothetical protein